MAKWSGLAKAVNAHLERWSKVNGESERLRILHERQGHGVNIEIQANQIPVLTTWGVFARTWGLPQADGSVITPTHIQEGATINGREQFAQTKASASHAPMFMAREQEMLSHAETVYVSEEIIDRITYAASSETMQPEPLFHTDMFAPYGLIVLEKPLLVPDYHPQSGEMTDYLHVALRALGWRPEPEVHRLEDGELKPTPGIMMFSYTTNTDWRESYETEVYRAIRQGKVDPERSGLMLDGELVPQGTARFMMAGDLPNNLLVPMDVMPWSFGREWTFKNKAIYEPGVVDSAVAYVRRWFLTLMRFTWQRLIVPERPEFSKKLARTAREFNKPDLQWSVLRIRRLAVPSTEETGTGRRLTYRVATRGHWRNVYYSSLGPAHLEDGSPNPDSHRLKWIDAFWRGPLDGPLGPQHKATVITR